MAGGRLWRDRHEASITMMLDDGGIEMGCWSAAGSGWCNLVVAGGAGGVRVDEQLVGVKVKGLSHSERWVEQGIGLIWVRRLYNDENCCFGLSQECGSGISLLGLFSTLGSARPRKQRLAGLWENVDFQ